MGDAPLRRMIGLLGLSVSACRGPDIIEPDGDITTKSESPPLEESESETGDLIEFDPLVCGSWQPPEAVAAGELPAEQDCGELCPMFTEVALAAGLGTMQYRPTHPSERECIFPYPTESGLSQNHDCEPQWFTGGASVADVDDDGWPDIYMTRLAAPDHLFHNQGDGTFVDIAAAVGLGGCSFSNGSVFGDIDEDGDLDLLVTSVGAHSYALWINQLRETGELVFEQQAEERGFAMSSSFVHSGQSVTLGDYDRDGWLDVHVNEWLRIEHTPALGDLEHALHGGRLLHNLGDGTFEDVSAALGVELHTLDEDGVFAFSSTFVDVDGDGWQDLAIAIDFHRSRMFWNEGGAGFLDGTIAADVNRESNAMGSTWADLDRDGDLDWFVTSIAELDDDCDSDTEPCWAGTGNRLYSYAGGRTFSGAVDEVGVRDGAWAWGTAFFDADNDGDQDLALTNGWPGRDLNGGFYHHDTPARLWIHDGMPMSEQALLRGVEDRGQGRGLVTFDYDRDGDLDLLLINHAGPPRLFRNDGGNRNPWLRVAVEGTVSNRDGRGAKIRVQVEPEGPWQIREVGVGSHFLGEGELIQHFGIGPGFDPQVDTVARVEVEWPASGIVQTFEGVAGNQTLTVAEAE